MSEQYTNLEQYTNEQYTKDQLTKLSELHSMGYKDKQLNKFKLSIYNWDIKKAVQYYEKDNFCLRYCIGKTSKKFGCTKTGAKHCSTNNSSDKAKSSFRKSLTKFADNIGCCDYQHSLHLKSVKPDFGKLLCRYFIYKGKFKNNARLYMHYADLITMETWRIANKTGNGTDENKDNKNENENENKNENKNELDDCKDWKYDEYIMKAEEYYSRSLDIDKTHGHTNYKYARLLDVHLKQYKNANKHYKLALKYNKQNHANRYYNYGAFLMNVLKNYKESKKRLDKAKELEPTNVSTRFLLGKVLYHLNEYEKSFAELETALNLTSVKKTGAKMDNNTNDMINIATQDGQLTDNYIAMMANQLMNRINTQLLISKIEKNRKNKENNNNNSNNNNNEMKNGIEEKMDPDNYKLIVLNEWIAVWKDHEQGDDSKNNNDNNNDNDNNDNNNKKVGECLDVKTFISTLHDCPALVGLLLEALNLRLNVQEGRAEIDYNNIQVLQRRSQEVYGKIDFVGPPNPSDKEVEVGKDHIDALMRSRRLCVLCKLAFPDDVNEKLAVFYDDALHGIASLLVSPQCHDKLLSNHDNDKMVHISDWWDQQDDQVLDGLNLGNH